MFGLRRAGRPTDADRGIGYTGENLSEMRGTVQNEAARHFGVILDGGRVGRFSIWIDRAAVYWPWPTRVRMLGS